MANIEKVDFHIVLIGWEQSLVESLWADIDRRSEIRFSNIMHPSIARSHYARARVQQDVHFFCDDLRQEMPEPDRELLASLEQEGVPTVHNMILGDRVVSTLPYENALRYATFLVRRLTELFGDLRPSVVFGGYDGIHGALALAVAKRMRIPWFALHFSVIPAGFACFSDRMSAAAQAQVLVRSPSPAEHRSLAETALSKFENESLQAPAYLAPSLPSWWARIRRLPSRVIAALRTIERGRQRRFLQFTSDRTDLSVRAAIAHLLRARRAHEALSKIRILKTPPRTPYVLFGLHLQPESAIDVWAPFFSNQMWVVELLSRSVPPSHKLLVKIHKSDPANYTVDQLRRMQSFPGVELVHPAAPARPFIEGAALVFGIQGTMGLEAALLGKPVIMLGDSPVTLFPNVSRIGAITDLPSLVRTKLAEPRPAREAIINAYARFLSPFAPASHNDWTVPRSAEQIDAYVDLFRHLRNYVESGMQV